MTDDPGEHGSGARLALFVVVAAAGALSLHCGTSTRVVHEGTMHFEHCYRLDLESASSDDERLACWQTWSARHAARHPGDRARYAERRRGEISASALDAPAALPSPPAAAATPPVETTR